MLHAILTLLCLINGIQLNHLNEWVSNASGQAKIDKTDNWGTDADVGLSITHALASPSEHVSAMAEEGGYFPSFCGVDHNLSVCLFVF